MDDQLQREMVIGAALGRMVVLRGGALDSVVAEAYIDRLKDCDPTLVERACEELGDQSPDQYETKVPPCPDILAIVERLESEATVLAFPLPPDPDEPTYACHWCRDDPAGFRAFECPEVPCGRKRDHSPHSYVARCHCWFMRHGATIRLARTRIDAKHGFVSQGMRDVEAFDAGRYPWATNR